MTGKTQKHTIKEIARYLGVKDLKLTDGTSGTMYTAKNRAGHGPRIFIAWDRKHLNEIAHVRDW
ncbi:MAG: hypothetical protein WCX79_00090 [Candidatus Paceibacterota bacterium]|jgi:hypothetical protein